MKGTKRQTVSVVMLVLAIMIFTGCAAHRGQEPPTTLPPIIKYEAKESPPISYESTKEEVDLATQKKLQDLAKQPLVSGIVPGRNLPDAFADIQLDTGINIIVADSVQGIVVNPPENIPFEEALNMLCFPGGYSWKKVDLPDGKFYYLVGSAMPGDPSAFALIITEKVKTNRPAAEVFDLLSNLSYKPFVSIIAPANLPTRSSERRATNTTSYGNQYMPLISEPESKSYELVITGPREIVERIKRDIKTIVDPPLKQIAVQVLFTEASFDKSHRIGVDWSKGLDANVSGSGAFTRGWEFGWQSNIMGELLSNIQAMVRKGQLELKDFPQIVTREGSLATINMQTQQWIRLNEPRSLKGDSYYFRAETETFTYGTILMVRPIIADNGDIVLIIAVEVDDVSGVNSDGLPAITRRSVTNEIKIKSGETVVIGGLYRELLKSDKTGVAGLSKLPIIDIPMSMRTKENQTKELTVFITAKVLEPVGAMAIVSEAPLAKGAIQTQVQVIEKEKLIEKEILVPMADPEEWKKAIERGQKDE